MKVILTAFSNLAIDKQQLQTVPLQYADSCTVWYVWAPVKTVKLSQNT